MATIKQIEANRRNSQLSTGPKSSAGKAVSRMNRLTTGIDAKSQIITGEDPEALERLTGQYYDRFYPQGPEEIALIDSAIASDWLLRRLRKTDAEIWNRSMTRKVDNQKKWGEKAELYPQAAAFIDQGKAFERLQPRISAAERSLRASLETLLRLRKQGGTALSSPTEEPAPSPAEGETGFSLSTEVPTPSSAEDLPRSLSPAETAPQPSDTDLDPAPDSRPLAPTASLTHSKQKVIGFVPANLPEACSRGRADFGGALSGSCDAVALSSFRVEARHSSTGQPG